MPSWRRSADIRVKQLGGVLVLLVALAGCGASSGPFTASTTHAENSVVVEVVLEVDESGEGAITATFTPDDEGWHLYSTDLNPDDVRGLGRPTVLDVTGGAEVGADVAVSVDSYDLELTTLDIVVPVYPDGPVVLTTPVSNVGNQVTVAVTYMSCNEELGCNIPVVGHELALARP